MLGNIEQYGVFAAMVAVAGMLVAAVMGLGKLWRGPLKGWEIPEAPIFANKLATLAAAGLVVVGFVYASPGTKWQVIGIGVILSSFAIAVGVKYASTTMMFRRFKDVVSGNQTTERVPVLAGDEVTPWAQKTMKSKNIGEQECFAGTPNAPFNADQMWPLASRVRVYTRMMWLFIGVMGSGTTALAWLSYGIEVQITKKPASDVLSIVQLQAGTNGKEDKKTTEPSTGRDQSKNN